MMTIFEKSIPGCLNKAQVPSPSSEISLPASMLRASPLGLPAVSELEVVRHYTCLSQQNFSIDTNFYPLGSCSMKYNARGIHRIASLPGFLSHHPLSHENASQPLMHIYHDLQTYLGDITGLPAVSLTPMAGAQGEVAGVMMIKAYHEDRQDTARVEMLVPDAAHGTNPASAAMCGYLIKEIPTKSDGDVDLEALAKIVGPQTAGIMLTNPSTLGVFERDIKKMAKIVHEAGGLLYYDGANLNAILGKVRPGDMGFDVMHMNLHKTFATPHGGGGPGAGPVAASPRLAPYLPGPCATISTKGLYKWFTPERSIGRLSSFMGNAGVLVRAYLYIRLLGGVGLQRVSDYATLNANYLLKQLTALGLNAAFPDRRATHEFILTLKAQQKATGITALDVCKRLLDFGFHAPTMYFPTFIPECLLIEPTETESKRTLDTFIEGFRTILEEGISTPEVVKEAPHTLKLKRLDDVKAARELDVVFNQSF